MTARQESKTATCSFYGETWLAARWEAYLGCLLAILLALGYARDCAASQNAPAVESAAGSEVERLRELLRRHNRATGAPAGEPYAGNPVGDIDLNTAQAMLARPFTADKVLLRDSELPLLIGQVQRRLENPLLEERRNDAALVGAVQTRRRGALVASSNFGLRHIGKHQFLGASALQAGRNTLSVSGKQWRVDIPAGEPVEYIVLLFAPPLAEWELHAVPQEALGTLGDAAPQWLEAAAAGTGDPA